MAKKRLATGYTFTAASKTVSHADFSDITLAGIQLIVNVTDQIIIYNFADTTKGGTLATDTLTLEYDTTSMSDTDELMILVEDGVATQGITASSLPLPTGASTLAEQQTQTTSLQLLDDTVYTDGTGTVTKGVAILGQDGTNPQAIKTDTNGELQVDVLTMPTVAVTQSGTWDEVGINDSGNSITVDNGGTFAVQVDGAALTSLQLADDVVYTDDTSTHSTGVSKGTGIMAVAAPTDASVDANDIGMLAMTTARALKSDITTIAGTAPTTAGFIDIKGADGNVFVRQATASNLNMTEASASSILTSVQLIDDMIYTDDTSTHSTGTSKGALIMAAATPTDTAVNANDIGAVGMTNNREMYVSLRDISGAAAVTGSGTATGALRVELPTNGTGTVGLNAGTNAIGKLAANSGVDIGDVDVTSIIPGTGATNLGKAEDAGHTSGDVGVMSLAVRADAGATGNPTTLATTSLDYIPLATDANNRLYTNVAGDIAHDAADSTSAPIKIGGQARQTNPTAVADADRVNAVFDDIGRIVTSDSHVRDLVVQQVTTITSSTSETTILTAGAAGVFHDIKSLMIANKSATASTVTIRDATAGSAIAYMHVPAGDTRGVVFNTPFKQTTAANNWTAQSSASVDSLYITVQAVKNV